MLSLSQLNFRNLLTRRVELCKGVTAVVGGNGAGKSNLLEACFLGLTGELPSGRITENLRVGEEQGFVGGRLQHDEGVSVIEVGLSRGRKTLKVDGQAARQGDLARISAAVLITPQDADLIHGAPALRRAYLDALLSRLSPRYAELLRAFGRVLEQRNAALRAGLADEHVDVWSERFVVLGEEIDAMRRRAVTRVAELASDAYSAIAGDGKELGLELQRPPDRPLAEELASSRGEERARGVTVVGPQRDDLGLTLDGLDVQAYGSRGEARTASLALRVAEYRLLERRHGEPPVLLLDDFTAELDPSRRGYLLELVRGSEQALVSGTEPPPEFDALLEVASGAVAGG